MLPEKLCQNSELILLEDQRLDSKQDLGSQILFKFCFRQVNLKLWSKELLLSTA